MSGIITGNVQSLSVISVALSPALIVLNTTAEQTFTVPGVRASDTLVSVVKPTAQAGLAIVGWRVTADNTVGITFGNVTGSSITPTAGQTYLFVLARPDSKQGGFNV